METNRIQLVKQFEFRLKESWDEYKIKHDIEEKEDSFITWLIDEEIINPKMVRHFTIRKDFKSYYNQAGSKTEIVKMLASKYGLSARSIWTIIRED